MGAVNLVAQIGALAIPGVGEAIDGGMSKSYRAEKTKCSNYQAGVDIKQLRASRLRN